jgi:putative transposase
MSNYRRNRILGGTYFFTVNLQDRKSQLLVLHINELRAAVRKAKQSRSFYIDAWVILPDHLHCIWTLPEHDDNYSSRWQAIKKAFSKSIPETEYRSETNRKRHERGIWQRRFWEHTITDDCDYAAHMDYIHYNPVKHGWAKAVKDWPYSTFHQLVEKGVYPVDWAGCGMGTLDVGESEE